MMSPLLRLQDNKCLVGLSEALLIEIKKPNELILLYKHNSLHGRGNCHFSLLFFISVYFISFECTFLHLNIFFHDLNALSFMI